MSVRLRWFATIVAVALLVAAVWAISRSAGDVSPAATAPASADAADTDQDHATATVRTAIIHRGNIDTTITAYGSITAEPSAVVIYSVPADARVARVYVVAGESTRKGQALVELAPTADTRLQLLDAQNGLESAKRNLTDTQQRFDLKLATNTELLQAQQAVQSAQLKSDDIKKRGVADLAHSVSAIADGVVTKIDVQAGQIVQSGSPLVEVLPKDQIEARVGVEQSVARQLQVGQAATLRTIDGAAMHGAIRSISQRVSQDSRLVDVFISLPPSASPLIDGFVAADVVLHSNLALCVPRAAVLPADQGYTLFTVKDGHAVKHMVTVPVQNDHEAAVAGSDLQNGDTVVVKGNLEIDDGTAVSTGEAK